MDEQTAKRRFIELYNDGLSFNKFAQEIELCKILFPEASNERTRAWRAWKLANSLVEQQLLSPRKKQEPTLKTEWGSDETPFLKYLERYEKLIGAPERRSSPAEKLRTDRYEAIVFSDPHNPDVRMSLVRKLIDKFSGLPGYLVGDIDDNEDRSKHTSYRWKNYSLEEQLAEDDAFVSLLTQHFNPLYIFMGNHDNRAWLKALAAAGKDYAWLSYQFIMWSWKQRHGVQVISNKVTKENGQEIPGLHFYHQVNDCMIGHVERSGKAASKSAELAHDFYFSWREILGLDPFRVVLQAHSHRTNYSRHPLTGAHLYEIGALCDIQDYAVKTQRYSPIQAGAFHLVQKDQRTLINESRLISLDEEF